MIKRAEVQTSDISSANDVDIDLGGVEKSYPYIPPGLYDVRFVKAHPMNIFKGKRLITYWMIQDLSSEYHGITLILSFQYPKKGRKWGPLSKLVQCIKIARGRDPDRFDIGHVSTRVFRKKLFSAEVVTVTKGNDIKGRKKSERPPENYYSVIDTLVALKVG